jgi:hypothetical protein
MYRSPKWTEMIVRRRLPGYTLSLPPKPPHIPRTMYAGRIPPKALSFAFRESVPAPSPAFPGVFPRDPPQ